VSPQIEEGRYPIKRVVGEEVAVEADIFTDGHDAIVAVLRYRADDVKVWTEVEMQPLGNDRWRAVFPIDRVGQYRYTIQAWVDHFRSWTRDFEKKLAAKQEMGIELLIGAELGEQAVARAVGEDRAALEAWVAELSNRSGDSARQIERARDSSAHAIMRRYPDRSLATAFERELVVWAEPLRARYGAWYELFPRSCGSDGKRHGTFRDVEAQLPRIAEMGFDVLYLPPIHPIGLAFRKGRNNSTQAGPADPGSPWALAAAPAAINRFIPNSGRSKISADW
jgi:starch synthase (maltosyl-transferring)